MMPAAPLVAFWQNTMRPMAAQVSRRAMIVVSEELQEDELEFVDFLTWHLRRDSEMLLRGQAFGL